MTQAVNKQPVSHRFLSLILAILANVISLPVSANSIEIIRATPDDDRILLKVRVINNQRIPIQGLRPEDFEIKTTDANNKTVRLKTPEIEITPPEKTKPDPAYLVILLDMSGSMRNQDRLGKIKLTGAINAIRDFLETIEAENFPVEIALVPFGEGGGGCKTYSVNGDIIKNSLEGDPYEKPKEKLKELAQVDIDNLCAATNIYQPLSAAVKFLGTEENFQEKSSKLAPRLGVILFTDGFDAADDRYTEKGRDNEKKRFQDLLNLLAQYPQVTVHTMGYGESLSQLRDRAKCYGYYPSDKYLTVDNILTFCRLKRQDIKEFVVDENRLTEIAQKTTGGIAKFPQDSQEVIDSLKTFLTTLRKYEITYQQPGADRASSHQTQVVVNSPAQGLNNLASQPSPVRMDNFFYHSLSGWERLGIFIGTILVSVGGIIRFNTWSKQLKEHSKPRN